MFMVVLLILYSSRKFALEYILNSSTFVRTITTKLALAFGFSVDINVMVA